MKKMIGVSLLAVLLATGCTRVVDGAVRPAPGLKPRPLHGPAVQQVALDQAQLSKMLGQSFKSDPNSPSRFGGSDQLSDMNASPRECAGVAFELQQSAYGSAEVKDVAHEVWWTVGIYHAKVISVSENVVTLPTAAAADALFAQFLQQWNGCNGTTVTSYRTNGEPFITAAISDARAGNSVLAATVRSHLATTVTHARALGVRSNCLVEVDVAFFADHPDGSAIDIAHRMMDEVSVLS
jgi:hypothetical protein